ncbi:XkdX family protein [Lysinibacillus sp. 1 U-2021]|nr:XkdX family protein [Lysinibacillus sp. 1 U-2021]WGT38007.1 XkdX family protein [Lysinibacillus sp. 1 U-2021]
MWYKTVKMYYDNGHPSYNNESIKVFVKAKMITVEEYELITKISYENEA